MSAEGKSRTGSEADEARPTEEESELDRKLAQYARFGLPIATVGVAMIAGNLQGPPAAVLMLAGGTLIGVIALLWASVRTLVGETPLSGADAYALLDREWRVVHGNVALATLVERSVDAIAGETLWALLPGLPAGQREALQRAGERGTQELPDAWPTPSGTWVEPRVSVSSAWRSSEEISVSRICLKSSGPTNGSTVLAQAGCRCSCSAVKL